MTGPSNNRRPAWLALAASALLTILILAGSRNLGHYDAALSLATNIVGQQFIFKRGFSRWAMGSV